LVSFDQDATSTFLSHYSTFPGSPTTFFFFSHPSLTVFQEGRYTITFPNHDFLPPCATATFLGDRAAPLFFFKSRCSLPDRVTSEEE